MRGKSQRHMLVFVLVFIAMTFILASALLLVVRLHLEWQRTAVQLDANYMRARAESGREIYPALSRTGRLRLEHDAVCGLVILKIHSDRSHVSVVNGERGPIGGRVRNQRDRVVRSIYLQSEHPTQNGTDDHGCGPDLVRRTGGERLVVVAGEDFGEMTERTVEGQQRVRAQVEVSGKSAVIFVLSD